MTKDNSFDSGEITWDYDYICTSLPHRKLVQGSVADAIKEYATFQGPRRLQGLEIGTGTGTTTLGVLEAVKSLDVVCVDISENMLAQARGKFAKAGFLERALIKNRPIQAELLETKDEQYDVIFSTYTIHNLLDKQRRELLPQVYRVLKTGGIFVLSDKLAANDPGQHQANINWYLGVLDRFFPAEKQQAKQELVDHTHFDEQAGQRWVEAEALHDLYDSGFKQAIPLYREKMEAGFAFMK